MEILERDVRARDVEVLAADHAERRLGELARRLRPVVTEREAKRLRQQCVAGEERDGLPVRDVRAWAAAPLVVVVERRQVVVDE